MKLSLVRVLPLAIALLVPSAALAEAPATGGAAGGTHKSHATHTVKRAKAGAKPHKAPKAAKKAPKAAKKAPKAAKKAAK
jgi:hypothetical protein